MTVVAVVEVVEADCETFYSASKNTIIQICERQTTKLRNKFYSGQLKSCIGCSTEASDKIVALSNLTQPRKNA